MRLRPFLKTIASLWLAVVFVLASPTKAWTMSLISDEETEQLLEKIIKPLFEAAGVPYHRNEIHIVDDLSLNAFVADGNHLFVHTGTILNAESANELAGVLAHETGHIQGGHILRQKIENQNTQEIGLVSALLAGTAAAVSGRGDVAMAAMLGSQSSMLTNYLHYRTTEERAADEAAMSLLQKTGQSPEGMLAFMKKISRQNRLSGYEEIPYFRTHPVTAERISFFEQAIQGNERKNKDVHQEEFNRVKAKLYAYLAEPKQTLQKYPSSDSSVPALYARSIAQFKALRFDEAQKTLDSLIAQEPKNPYFHELKAQLFLEIGKLKQAKENYKKALELMPQSALLQLSYAQSLLEDSPTQAEAEIAIKLLNKSLISRPNGFAWMLLARGYAISGNQAGANYAAAEYSYFIGEPDTAKKQLKKALDFSPSPQMAVKIDDLSRRVDEILSPKQ